MEKSLSLFSLIGQADIVVQIVMTILAAASLWSWAIVFDKIMKFRTLKARSDDFEHAFETMMIEDLYSEAKKNDNHPLARIFIACMKEWKNSNVKKILDANASDKKESLKARLMTAMQIAISNSTKKLEDGLNFLAIIGSVAPFVGLFGTVWGIMTSFQGIAISKNTSLSVVAPGIAEALLATGIGLFAAIPAVFFYNVFSNKINQFSDRANNFSLLLLNSMSRELDRN